MTNDNFTIKSYHWWLTIVVAMLLHALLIINYKQENTQQHEHANIDQHEIIIGLKNLKQPPIIKKPNVLETHPVTPVPVMPKPELIKKKIIKPKPIVKPTPKKVIGLPVITQPQIAPLSTSKKPKKTSSLQNRTNSDLAKAKPISSPVLENQKALYYATLAKWLERHKKYPTIARRRNQQGEVTIKFVINRQGELLHYDFVKSSEYHSLNTATVKMLERASPMPTPPKEIIGDKDVLEFTIPVNFSLLNN